MRRRQPPFDICRTSTCSLCGVQRSCTANGKRAKQGPACQVRAGANPCCSCEGCASDAAWMHFIRSCRKVRSDPSVQRLPRSKLYATPPPLPPPPPPYKPGWGCRITRDGKDGFGHQLVEQLHCQVLAALSHLLLFIVPKTPLPLPVWRMTKARSRACVGHPGSRHKASRFA